MKEREGGGGGYKFWVAWLEDFFIFFMLPSNKQLTRQGHSLDV
jgi:hypothetical protein